MARGLILVRHAMPLVTPGVASTLWPLSEHAREDCVLLAHALPDDIGPIFTSSEVKARETAAVLALRKGVSVVEDAGFGEVDRPAVWDEDYRAAAAGYLAGQQRAGWEPRERVVARFGAAVDRALAGGGEGDLVVVNHGLALSLWLASTVAIDLVGFWRALSFPDAWRLDVESRALERLNLGEAAPDAETR